MAVQLLAVPQAQQRIIDLSGCGAEVLRLFADGLDFQPPSEAKSLPAMIASYARPGGWSELDRGQRLLEQSVAECVDGDELEPAVTRCRSIYRQVIDAIQQRFIRKG